MTRSAFFGSFATAAFAAAIPSGCDVGPALMACAMCLPLYNTGNATDKRTGALPDRIACASSAGCNNSPAAQGSEATSWPKQLQPAKHKIAIVCLCFITKSSNSQEPLHSVYDCVQRNAGPHRCGALSVVREIIPADFHRLALRRQQFLSNLARV